jgi:MFS family permease
LHKICFFFLKSTILGQKTKNSDWMGMAASLACLIHCTAGSFALILQPFIGGAIALHKPGDQHPSGWHIVFFILALLAVWYASHTTRSKQIRIALWSSLAAFGIGAFSGHDHHLLSGILLYGGSIGLVVAHYFNLRQGNSCPV